MTASEESLEEMLNIEFFTLCRSATPNIQISSTIFIIYIFAFMCRIHMGFRVDAFEERPLESEHHY